MGDQAYLFGYRSNCLGKSHTVMPASDCSSSFEAVTTSPSWMILGASTSFLKVCLHFDSDTTGLVEVIATCHSGKNYRCTCTNFAEQVYFEHQEHMSDSIDHANCVQ